MPPEHANPADNARRPDAVSLSARTLLLLLVLILVGTATAGATTPAPGSAALAERRVALVVGNEKYTHVPPLDNPGNDARLMAGTLKTLGFTLVGDGARLDLDRQGLERALHDFGKESRGAAVALFYYSGHGVQVDGRNYLIPVTANVEEPTDVKYQFVDADYVLEEMEASGTQVNVVVLDACRNNPFGGRGLRSAASGLAQMNAPRGTLLAYSTAPGRVAADGQGRNSPYTAALARALTVPGQRIEDVFIAVGRDVEKATGGNQEPWQANNLRGVFYVSGPPSPTATAPASATNASSPIAAGTDKEALFWQSIQTSATVADFKAYLEKFPTGTFAPLARARIEALERAAATPPGTSTGARGNGGDSGPPPRITGKTPAPPHRPDGRPGPGSGSGPGPGPGPGQDTSTARPGPESGRPLNRIQDAELRTAVELLRKGEYARAEVGFTSFLSRRPDDPAADMAFFGLAQSYFAQAKYAEAALNYATAYRRRPNGRKADEALFRLGLSYQHLGRIPDACLTFRRLVAEKPANDHIRREAQNHVDRLGCRKGK